MAIFAGPAKFRAPNHPPSCLSQRLSMSTATDARVLAVALGIRGAGWAAWGACAGWVAGAAGLAGIGWPWAPRSAAVNANAARTTDREAIILPSCSRSQLRIHDSNRRRPRLAYIRTPA